MKIRVKKSDTEAKLPVYGSSGAAGIDVYACLKEPLEIAPGNRVPVPTGIQISYDDPDYYFRIAPRSGLSVKNSIDIGAGVVDFDYRGQIHVVLINNHPSETFKVEHHQKIAQMVPTMSISSTKVTIEETDELDETVRGGDGFGSTGNF